MFGGFASDYRVFSKMLRTLAQGCGSSAWVAAVHGEHNWVVGNFRSKRSATCGAKIPTPLPRRASRRSGSAEPVAGGHRLSGRWGFASGCDHAQWILLGSMAKTGGAPELRMFLVPIGEVEIIDDWHVMGLCGTGSKSIVVKDVIVPRRIRSACTSSRPAPRRARRFIVTIRSTARPATCWRCSR